MTKKVAKKFDKAKIFSNLATRYLSLYLVVGIVFLFSGCEEKEPDRTGEAHVIMTTDLGDIYLKLFDDVPKHKANFLKLAKEGFYDGMSFHRVINQFMIQTGDPRSIEGATTQEDDAGYNLPAEINEKYLHLEGRIAAARYPDQVNPFWESSSSQFYIVTGKPVTAKMLDEIEETIAYAQQIRLQAEHKDLLKKGEYRDVNFNNYLADQEYVSFTYSKEQREEYQGKFGAPNLDFQYTVFGEVVGGMDIVRKIQAVPTGQGNVPIEPIRIQSMKVL